MLECTVFAFEYVNIIQAEKFTAVYLLQIHFIGALDVSYWPSAFLQWNHYHTDRPVNSTGNMSHE